MIRPATVYRFDLATGRSTVVSRPETSVEQQTASAVLMVRPRAFGFNPETAASNHFAQDRLDTDIAQQAVREFNALADALDRAGVAVMILDDCSERPSPDAVFPNNWVSFHADGTVVLYPMCVPSRQRERRFEPLHALLRAHGLAVHQVIDLSGHERAGRYLEGTGSLIFDRPRRQAYAALGPRTSAGVIADFDQRTGYSTCTFEARDPQGRPIYHTNVLMSLGEQFAIVCLTALDGTSRRRVTSSLEATGRTIIDVDFEQVEQFACNIIELRNSDGGRVTAMSTRSLSSLRPDQRSLLRGLTGTLVDVEIGTIESIAGGSVRCMLADIHLPRL